jgi:L-alanine-DL-glutamate epimerase-like enolase superfamily enzyme
MKLALTVAHESFPVAGDGFVISRGARRTAEVVVATLSDGVHAGRGECVPYARYGETLQGVMAAIEAMAPAVAAGLDRQALQRAMPPGAARNAIDCAFWDLEAKRAGVRAWEIAGLGQMLPIPTCLTLSIDTPEAMRRAAAANSRFSMLKVKLGGDANIARVRAVREGAPGSIIIVDANEAWTPETYRAVAPELASLGVVMVEQPLPAGQDDILADMDRIVPVCADESFHDRSSLAKLRFKYDMVNIKLDKAGGLTEALALREEAEAEGYGVMVGCMLSTSLSIAPTLMLAQGVSVVDVDAPLLLARDRDHGIHYDVDGAHPPVPALWG